MPSNKNIIVDRIMNFTTSIAEKSSDKIFLSKVLEVNKVGNILKIQRLDKDNDEGDFAEWIYLDASKTSRNGGLPQVNSIVITLVDSLGDYYCFGGVFDEENNTKPAETDGDEDKNSFRIERDGNIIELFKDNTNKYHINITCDNEVEVICNKIYLGDKDNSEELVQAPHLDKYNDALDSVINDLTVSLATQPLIGDLGIPLPFSVRMPTYSGIVSTVTSKLNSKKDTTNKTSKTKAS